MQLNRRTVITINGRDITSRITSGTIRISEMIANEEFRFGELCIDMFECQVYGFDNDVSGQEIFVNCIYQSLFVVSSDCFYFEPKIFPKT